MNYQPLILTLTFADATFALLDGLRRQHFPPERNFIPAHVTLFHALPGEQQPAIIAALERICNTTAPLPLALPAVRFLGRGVALEVESAALRQLRAALAREWGEWLGAQDRQGYRPHVTIQNKVDAPTARELYTELSANWQQHDAVGEGLTLWYYHGGPWELAGEFPFRG